MNFKKFSAVVLSSLSLVSLAHANEVLLTANQPIKITFRIAHKNKNKPPIFDKLQTLNVNKNVTIPISLDGYDRAGVIIVSGDGHELPPSVNQFDEPNQCSMTTDKTKATGALDLTMTPHSINCRTYGGVYG